MGVAGGRAIPHWRGRTGVKIEVGEVGGAGTIAHAGAVLPRLLADRLGLTGDLAQVVARAGFSPLRHRGRVLVDTACALGAGATALTDVEALTRQVEIYGPGGGASDTTVLRGLDELAERLGGNGLPGRRLSRAMARARERAWAAIIDRHGRLPAVRVAGTDLRRTGELTSRLTADATVVQNTVSVNLSMGLRNLVMVVGGLAMLLVTSPPLTALMLALVPPVALGAVIVGRRMSKLAKAAQDALARANEAAEESIAGIRTVRAFAREQAEAERYGERVWESFRVSRRRPRSCFSPSCFSTSRRSSTETASISARCDMSGAATPSKAASRKRRTSLRSMSALDTRAR